MAARVRTTIAPASVDIDKRSIVDVARGRVTVVVVQNNGPLQALASPCLGRDALRHNVTLL